MKLKEIESKLIEYIELDEKFEHRENALKEFEEIRKKFKLSKVYNIGFIIDEYPKYDHFLCKVDNDDYFFKIGFNRKYLKSLSKKDVHSLAKKLWKMFRKFELKDNENE